MKNLFLVVFITLASLQIILAQNESNIFHKDRWELDFTGSLGSISSSSEFSAENNSNSYSESRNYLLFGIIPAYYLIDGLAIEPEINMFFEETQNPAYMLLGNLAYTFKIENSRIYPFLRAGYGVTNSFQVPVKGHLSRMTSSLDIGILNLGGGIKILLTENILLRAELNYREFSYSNEEYSFGYNNKISLKLSSAALLFGFSLLL